MAPPEQSEKFSQSGRGMPPVTTSAGPGSTRGPCVITGAQAKSPAGPPAYQNVFGDQLVREGERDPNIVAITAAMPSGTGLDLFAQSPAAAAATQAVEPDLVVVNARVYTVDAAQPRAEAGVGMTNLEKGDLAEAEAAAQRTTGPFLHA